MGAGIIKIEDNMIAIISFILGVMFGGFFLVWVSIELKEKGGDENAG